MTAVSRTRVKVCGITSAQDARAAARAGADALGVILAPGHRRSLTIAEAIDVLRTAPARVKKVGVFVDAALGEVCDAVAVLGLDEVQLHGDEPSEYCRAVPAPVVKTFRVGDGFDPKALEPYRGAVDAVLLDTLEVGAAGGTGRSFDWRAARGLPDVAPFYLAGGLTPGNVGRAIRELRPDGVDVSSGVEDAPRRKSESKMKAFVEAVRAAQTGEETQA